MVGGSAPNLPERYNQLIHGLQIGPQVGSCGTAAYCKQRVIVSDTYQDAKWSRIQEQVKHFGLRSCWSQPIVCDSGKVLGTFAIYRKIPHVPTQDEIDLVSNFSSLALIAIERTRSEETLKLRDAELVHVARLATLGAAVAEIGHEINQPLFAISNFSQACLRELENLSDVETDTLGDWIHRIQKASTRASDILSRSMDFAKRNSGQREACDAVELVHSTIEMLSWRRDAKGIAIEVHAPISPIEFYVDRIQIGQVLLNLLNNGCDALESKDQSNGRIEIDIQCTKKTVEFLISDNGPGISTVVKPALFEPFASTKGGLGMGLAISKSIVEEHGGAIEVLNSQKTGACFRVRIPRSPIGENHD